MRRSIGISFLLLGAMLAMAPRSRAAYYDQDFNDFAYAYYGTTVTNGDGWAVSHCYVSNAFRYCRMGATNYQDATRLAYVISPLLTNGIGRISWETKNQQAGNNVYDLQYSTNGTAWTWGGAYTNSDVNWISNSLALISYASVYVRFIKTADPGGPNDRLYFDNIRIIPAASYVVITNIALSPDPPLTDGSVQVSATILPCAQAGNVSAWVYYATSGARPFANYASMSTTGNNYYVTSSGIPAHSQPGLTVKYYLYATFSGVTPLTPTSSPPGSVGYYWYFLRAASNESAYPNMQITGAATTNMLLAADYLWQGVITPPGPLTNPTFSFASGTNSWGDTNQPVTALPVYGAADPGANINVNETVTNYLSFLFNETNLSYSIQNSSCLNFDAWTNGTTASYGAYTNGEGWVIAGRINTLGAGETARAFINRYGILHPTLPINEPIHYLQSPQREGGIGSVSFWYRNWDAAPTNPATDAAGFTVQKSTNGAAGTWMDISPTIWQTNILSTNWLYFAASVADRKSAYVRIVNTNNTSSRSWLCLDEVVVTDPGATVDITENPRNPTTPLAGQWVDVSINVTPWGGATNLACAVYQQPEGMATVPYAMTRVAGNTFSVSLPPSPPGRVYYYYACNYGGFNATPIYYPDGAPGQTLVYTNLTDPGSARQQDFLPFNIANYGTTVTNSDGWSVSHCYVSNAFAHCRMGPTNYGGGTRFAYLASPLLTNGFGNVSWSVRNYQAGQNTYEAQYSTDQTNWVSLGAYANDSTAWVTNRVWGGIYEDSCVRIIKTGDPGEANDRLYFDDILISPPPCDVVISEPPFFTPGYPARNQPVTVSVFITDRSANYPACNRITTLHYTHSGGAGGVVAMTQGGGNAWSAVVPGFPAGVVSYYIRCCFDGYYYTNGAFSENQSPAFSPDAPPTAPEPSARHTHTIREFESDYDSIKVNLSYTNTPIAMRQLNDYEWQGILDFGYGTMDPALNLAGFSWFTQTNYWGGTNEWGDPGQTRSSLPLTGVMSAGPSNITLCGPQYGQVVIRFNESSSNYTVQRCAYQDFNRWSASSDFFEETCSSVGVTSRVQNFDTWATNPPYIQKDDFESAYWWNNIYGSHYPSWDTRLVQGPSFWTFAHYKLTNNFELAGVGKCAVLKDEANSGLFYSSYRNPIADNGHGLGFLEMDFRCQDNNWKPTLYEHNVWSNSAIEAAVTATELPISANGLMLGPSWLSLLSRYTAENNYYELRWEHTGLGPSGLGKRRLGIYRRSPDPVGFTLLESSAEYNGFLSTTNTLRFVVSAAAGGKVYLQGLLDGARVVHAIDNTGYVITDPGSIGINTRDASIMVTNITAGWAQAESFRGWPDFTEGSDTNFVTNGWAATRICDSNGSGDSWIQLRAWSAAGQPPAVVSPKLPHGLGFVNYRYKKFEGNPTLCKTQWSTNLADWVTVDACEIGGSDWQDRSFTVTNALPANIYVRFLNSTNASGVSTNLYLARIALHPSPTRGYAENFSDNQAQGWTGDPNWWKVNTNGVPRYTRTGYAAAPLKFVVSTAKESDESQLALDSPWVFNAAYTVSNVSFVHLSHPIRWAEHPGTLGEGVYVRVKHTDTDASLVVDNVQIDRWHGYTANVNGWSATECWTSMRAANDDYTAHTNCLELRHSRAYTNIYERPYSIGGQYARSPYLTNGIGVLSFSFKNVAPEPNPLDTGQPVSFDYYQGEWTNLPDFAGLTPYISGTTNNFDTAVALRPTNFAIRFTGYIYIPTNGAWLFSTESSEGSKLYIDGTELVNNDGIHAKQKISGSNTLNLGWHDIKVTYFNGAGTNAASLEVRYAGPGVSDQPIPSYAMIVEPAVVKVETAATPFPSTWNTRATYTNNCPTKWTSKSISINIPSPYIAARILHVSTNYQTGILLDNFEVNDFVERDQFTWVAYNALITSNQASRLMDIKGGYLNYDTVNQTAKPPMTNDRPYIQSANLTNGIGEISFWYRAWGGAPPAGNPGIIRIVKAPVETAPAGDWLPLLTISNITTTTFTYFTTNFYDATNHYVRLYSDTTGVGRVCLDNVLITAPFGADISMTNLYIEPAIPLNTNAVHVYVDLFDFFLNPQNIAVSLHYYAAPNQWGTLPNGTRFYQGTNQWGAWTGGSTIPMTVVSTNGYYVRYKTTSPIPVQAIDQPVQYYASVAFTGMFSEAVSPRSCRQFVNAAHYYPINLNAGLTTNRIPYYIVFSCLPGHVWINEINTSDDSYWPTAAMQYVELCGRTGSTVSNWWIQIFSPGYSQLAWYRVTNPPALTDENNGYGFWVFGDSHTPSRDLTMTVEVGSPPHESRTLPAAGGIRLRRSMGAYEQAISYDAHEGGGGRNLEPYGFVYVGPDDDFLDSPVSAYGTGSNSAGFTWRNDTTPFTPGAVNTGQTLLDWRTGGEQNAPLVAITAFWIEGGTSAHVTCTGTNGWSPWLYYCTNLLTTPTNGWTLATTNSTYANGTNQITSTVLTNLPVIFYRVVATNSG
ncbi:MAG: PA14 domain-containing protein [Verrucomicrobiota bacterium]|nr:PA14 domain-containing protein [Verrucomicrobiota bacterium]